MSHTYVSLAEFKGPGLANLQRAGNDAEILAVLEAASRQVEDLTGGRRFFATTETRYFSGNGGEVLEFPEWDIISVSTLKEDTNTDGTYETTWATTDYELGPYHVDPTRHSDPEPYWRLEVNQRSNGNQDVFLKGQKMYELVGSFGFCNLTTATGTTINEGAEFSSSDTTLTVADGTKVGIGDTLLIESEHLYVTGQAVEGSNDYTVSRGANGTTAAAHADTTAISKLVYPSPVVQAVKMRAAQMWRSRVSGYSDRQGFSETGFSTIDQDAVQLSVRQMLDGYRRRGVA